jgi:hypothetical protein
MTRKSHARLAAALLVALMAFVAAPGAPASAACSWKVVASPNDGSTNNELDAVSASSASNVWAVGANLGGSQVPIAEFWNGSKWTLFTPSFPNSGASFQGVVDVSKTETWAAGYSLKSGTTYEALTERWNGSTWSQVAVKAGSGHATLLNGITTVSSTERWAVGESIAPGALGQTFAIHWGGKEWAATTTANVPGEINVLGGTSGTSESDIWAVGVSGAGPSGPFKTLTEHWNGKSWSIVSSPNVGGASNFLQGVVAISTTDVWAVGYATTASNSVTLTEHWNGKAWSIVKNPAVAQGRLFGVSAVATNNVFAVGQVGSGNFTTLTELWNGKSWAVVPSGNVNGVGDFLSAVAAVPATTNYWAVGGTLDSSLQYLGTLTEEYTCASLDGSFARGFAPALPALQQRVALPHMKVL